MKKSALKILFAVAFVMSLLIGGIALSLPTRSHGRIADMEAAVHQLSTNNRAASLNIEAVVEKYIEPGSDLSTATSQLSAAGYTISDVIDRDHKIILAEKSICPVLSPLTGFCRKIRIAITPSGQKVDSIQAFLYSNSL